MILVGSENLSTYLEHDKIAQELDKLAKPEDSKLICQDWLIQTDAKRFIFYEMYRDLLECSGLRILDVGGGLTSFTRLLARQHDYVLVDMLAHDEEDTAECFRQEAGRDYIHSCDWYDFKDNKPFDIVIANDLFPNVDQRLDLFIERYLSSSDEMRLSLTYYNEPRFYKTRRIDADEYLCMLAWDGQALYHALKKYRTNIIDQELDLLVKDNESVYPNNRQVCLVKLSCA